MSDTTVEQQTFTDLMNIHRHHTHRIQEDNDKAIKILLDKINDPEKINWHPRFYKTLVKYDITLPLVDLVDFRYVLMTTFQGAHTEIANLKSSLRLIISGSPHSHSTDIRRGEKKGEHQSKPAQSLCTVCGKFLTIVRLAQPKAALMLTSHRALMSALLVMLSLSPTRGLGVTSLERPLSSPTRTRRRKLSQLIRPSL